MSYSLLNVPTADGYPDPTAGQGGAAIVCPGAERFVISVTNAAAILQPAGAATGGRWGTEEFLLPGVIFTFERAWSAVRFRSARAGVPAAVSVSAQTGSDIRGEDAVTSPMMQPPT